MSTKKLVLAALSALTLAMNASAQSENPSGRFVRLAELEIDLSQMDK